MALLFGAIGLCFGFLRRHAVFLMLLYRYTRATYKQQTCDLLRYIRAWWRTGACFCGAVNAGVEAKRFIGRRQRLEHLGGRGLGLPAVTHVGVMWQRSVIIEYHGMKYCAIVISHLR